MKETLRIALKAADEKKAVDPLVLDISEIASFATHFILCSGESSRQIQAIADGIELALKAAGVRPLHIEGYENAEWVLLDYGDLVVHVFSPRARQYYDLERLWRDGKAIEIEKLLAPAVARRSGAKTRKKTESQPG